MYFVPFLSDGSLAFYLRNNQRYIDRPSRRWRFYCTVVLDHFHALASDRIEQTYSGITIDITALINHGAQGKLASLFSQLHLLVLEKRIERHRPECGQIDPGNFRVLHLFGIPALHIKPGCGQGVGAEVIWASGRARRGDDDRTTSVLGDRSVQIGDVFDDLGRELCLVVVDGGFVVGGGVAG